MDESNLNLRLKLLIQEVCSHPLKSSQRRIAINNLLRVLQKYQKSRDSYRNGGYIDEYEEAVYKTMFKVSETICEKYNPSRSSPLTWFNRCLRNQWIDEIRATKRHESHKHRAYPNQKVQQDPLEEQKADLDGALIYETWELFVQWINDDPNHILRDCFTKIPEANCQFLAHSKRILGRKWKEIAGEVSLPRGTVTSHWCRKCEPLIREWYDKNQMLFGEDNYE
jgi:RNA polymerase sigma factor (sigma-70 family)